EGAGGTVRANAARVASIDRLRRRSRDGSEARAASRLAARAEEGAALADASGADRRAAARTGFPRAVVDREVHPEVARLAVGGEEVAQRRPAALDGVGEHFLHAPRELVEFGAGHAAGAPARREARAPQRLVRVDVAD